MWSSLDDFSVGDSVMVGVYNGCVYTGTIYQINECNIHLEAVIVHELNKAKTYTKCAESILTDDIEVMAHTKSTPYIRNWSIMGEKIKKLEVDKYER